MRFRSYLFILNLLTFGSPIAVPREEKSDTFREPDQALSARDNADVLQDFWDQPPKSSLPTGLTSDVGDFVNQPLSDEAQSSSTNDQPPSIPSTGTLLAQNAYSDGVSGGITAVEGVLGAAAAAFTLFLQRSQDVSRLLQDDYSSNVKITNINPLIQSPSMVDHTQEEGATSNPTGARSAAATKTSSDSWCPPEHWGERNLAWCDWGQASSIVFTPAQNIYSIRGFALVLTKNIGAVSVNGNG
ncbi:hypothetical protein MMC22_002356 [Lobaria immixta]|nr:hypothetical protein [Lobaria immixta]